MAAKLSHIAASGEARMVDVSAKDDTARVAIAEGSVVMAAQTLALILSGDAKKGDVLGAARIAGIMAAKRTHELIPLCHPLLLTKVAVDIEPDAAMPGLRVRAQVKTRGQTGVEMEALTAVSIACLTIYDMAKAADRGMRIEGVRLLEKSGGKSGDWRAAEERVMSGDGMISVAEALARVLASAPKPVGRESVAIEAALGRTLGQRSSRPAHPAAFRQFGDGRLCAARRRHRAPPRAAEDYRRIGGGPRLRRHGRRGRGGAHFHRRADARGRGRRADPGECRARRRFSDRQDERGPAAQCARRRHRFCRGRTLAAGRTPPDARAIWRWRRPPIIQRSTCAAGRASPCWRPATNSCGRARRSGRRRSSPPTITRSPASSRPAAANRSISASPSTMMDALARSFRRAQEIEADVLVTLGGASVGDYDLVQRALVDAGLELGFWRIAMRPGKPLMQGRLGAMRVLGLPGNPVSSIVCAILFLAPAAARDGRRSRRRRGCQRTGASSAPMSAANDVRQDYLRATLRRGADGALLASPFASQDSSLVKLLAQAQCLVIRPPHAPAAKRGEACRIIRLDGSAI